MLSAEEITRAEFDEVLTRYPALISTVSNSKTSAGDNKEESTLEQLDKFRFEVAPERYFKEDELKDPNAPPKPLSHADVLQLVKWKLKHGTFRPNLMKLVESNLEVDTVKAVKEAFEAYKQNGFSVTKAINRLTSLNGIGPATASLILSVHDPSKVVFFADELFLWACHNGNKAQIKYTLKEYEELVKKSQALIDRLGVDGRDVEQVGFVLVREAVSKAAAANPEAAKPNGDKSKGRGRPRKDALKPVVKKETPKRKRQAKPFVRRLPTDMTEERKAQLQEVAAKGRAAREAKKQAKLEKGTKFRERVDAAREKKDATATEVPVPKTGAKRKSDTAAAASSKRVKRK